jgi:hypothetical protein
MGKNTVEVHAYEPAEDTVSGEIAPDAGEFGAYLRNKGSNALQELLSLKSDYNLAIQESKL